MTIDTNELAGKFLDVAQEFCGNKDGMNPDEQRDVIYSALVMIAAIGGKLDIKNKLMLADLCKVTIMNAGDNDD